MDICATWMAVHVKTSFASYSQLQVPKEKKQRDLGWVLGNPLKILESQEADPLKNTLSEQKAVRGVGTGQDFMKHGNFHYNWLKSQGTPLLLKWLHWENLAFHR